MTAKKLKPPTPTLGLSKEKGKRIKYEIISSYGDGRGGNQKIYLDKGKYKLLKEVESGRKAHVVLRWHADYQIYEYLHVCTSKKRAEQYLNDTFRDIKKVLSPAEFNVMFQIKPVVAW